MNTNYKKICSELLKNLPEKQKEIILRRFALQALPEPQRSSKRTSFSSLPQLKLRWVKKRIYPLRLASSEGGVKRETLESIGKSFGITRERVRQIENDGLSKLIEKASSYQKVFEYFTDELKKNGDLKREEILLSQLGGQNLRPQIFFLLTLGDAFQRFSETKELHSFWTTNPDSLNLAKETIASFYEKLKEINRPIRFEEYKIPAKLTARAVGSFLEISKIIQKNQEDFYGLKDWPEINPRGVKNKAYVVLKKESRPLHFTEVSKLIGPEALPQTVHNELIKDSRFVLVGRGLYALKEWGYEEGQVKDIILKILKTAGKPLPKEEILEEVMKQRMVKENTIFLNLNNKKYFLKTPEGKYISKDILSGSSKYKIQKA